MTQRPLRNPFDPALPVWRKSDGSPVSCTEKVKVLNDNYVELRQLLKDFLEDGLLLGCDEAGLREQLRELVATLPLDVRPEGPA